MAIQYELIEIINEARGLRGIEVPLRVTEAEEEPRGIIRPKDIESSDDDEPYVRKDV